MNLTDNGLSVDTHRVMKCEPATPMLSLFWTWLHCLWLRYEIDSAEKWVAMCVRDGISSTEQMAYQRWHIEALRVKLALLEAGSVPPKSPEAPVQSFDNAAELMLGIALACIASCFGLFVLFGMLPNGVTQ